jgi:uncharacterized protein YbjT (DUF2867 family)
MHTKRHVFVTGGTGYMGRRLIAELTARGHRIRALARPGSERKLPAGAEPVIGDALDANSYRASVPPCDTFVQLVGVAHPSPAKAAEFRAIDLPAGKAGVSAAADARVAHFVYVSVAQPSQLMKAYIEARAEVEEALRASGLKHTILRPWYVLGPGHRWPYALIPVYKVMELLPSTRDSAKRLGLVTLPQMIAALVTAVENPSADGRIVTVPEIRASSLQ